MKELRTLLRRKPPTFSVVDLGEEGLRGLKLESEGTAQILTLYSPAATGPTPIPKGHDTTTFVAALVDVEVGEPPEQLLLALENFTPVMVFGGSTTKVTSYGRRLLEGRGELLARDITLYTRPAGAAPGTAAAFKTSTVTLIGPAGCLAPKVCTTPLPASWLPALCLTSLHVTVCKP